MNCDNKLSHFDTISDRDARMNNQQVLFESKYLAYAQHHASNN